MKYLLLLLLVCTLSAQDYYATSGILIHENGNLTNVKLPVNLADGKTLVLWWSTEPPRCTPEVKQDWKMITAWSVFWTGITYIICTHQRGRFNG